MSTSFQEKVYRIVKQIPQGEVLTYKQVAEKIGNKNAFRAVGNALNKNRDPAIPCHRVIKSNGTLGGYYKGQRQKRNKLKEEGFVL